MSTKSNVAFRREYIDNFLTPVMLTSDFQPSGLSLDILKAVNEHIGTTSYLVGGALRDEFKGTTPKDYDVHLCYRDTKAARTSSQYTSKHDLIQGIAAHFHFSGEFENTSGVELTRIGKHVIGNIQMIFNGETVDVTMTPDQISLEERAMYGDATINSIAMNAGGEIMCHPCFEDDMQDERYALRVIKDYDRQRANDRYAARTDYLKDFTLMQPEEHRADL